jgi:hypothetical protein
MTAVGGSTPASNPVPDPVEQLRIMRVVRPLPEGRSAKRAAVSLPAPLHAWFRARSDRGFYPQW